MSDSAIARDIVLQAHSFALQLHKSEKLGQRKVTRLLKQKFGADFNENTVSGWLYAHNVPFSQEKTWFKPKRIPNKELLKTLYVQNGQSAQSLAPQFGVSDATVRKWVRGHGFRARTHLEAMNQPLLQAVLREQKLFRPKKGLGGMSVDKAYLFGVLCGDGHINKDFIRFEIRKDEEFSKEFAKRLNNVYGTDYSYHYYAPRNTFVLTANSQIICADLRSYGNFRTFKWGVPNAVLESKNSKYFALFLKGFFDSEGSVGKYIVSACSVSRKGARGVVSLLRGLGIRAKLYKHGKANIISITKKENIRRFKELVGFTIERKRQKLDSLYGCWKDGH